MAGRPDSVEQGPADTQVRERCHVRPGDPPLRRPRAADAGPAGCRLRQGAPARWSKTSPRRCWTHPGLGLAAPQIGVWLRVFTYDVDDVVGHLINPVLDLTDEEQFGEEGCLSLPGLTFDCRRAFGVVAKGFNMYGDPVVIEGTELLARCVQHETDHLDGVLFIDRLDPEQRKAAMKAIREADWAGEQAPTIKASPHATRGLALLRRPAPRCGSSSPGLRTSPARHWIGCVSSQHTVVGRDHPTGRPTRAGPHADEVPSRRAGRPSLESRCCGRPASPMTRCVERELRALAPDCCPVVAYGGLVPPELLDLPPHGWVNLHFSLLPMWRGAAPVQHAVLHGDEVTGASTFRLDEPASTPARSTERSPSRSHRPTPQGSCSDASAGVSRCRAAGPHPRRDRGRPAASRSTSSTDGVSVAPKLTVDDARVRWSEPALAVDRRIRACTPDPGAWTEYVGSAPRSAARGRAGDSECRTRRGARPRARASCGSPRRAIFVGTGSVPVQLGQVRPAGKEERWMPPTGLAGRDCPTASTSSERSRSRRRSGRPTATSGVRGAAGGDRERGLCQPAAA